MNTKIFPPVKSLICDSGTCTLSALQGIFANAEDGTHLFTLLPAALRPLQVENKGYRYRAGQPTHCPLTALRQSYCLVVSEGGIALEAADQAGLRYGLDTLAQIIAQAEDGRIPCLRIEDSPALTSRGLMLDITRGKVYTRAYLLALADLLGQLRFNVLQLYVEHTFDFQSHPEISRGSGALTAEDILALQTRCKENGIELQANLQSLGHCRRILTRPEHRHLAESDMYWSLDTVNDTSIDLLADLYAEYLPLFESPWLNVCMDEPYDIGAGLNANSGLSGQELYLAYLLKVRQLAARFGKRLMLFGDVFCRHPELFSRLPDDVLLLDWCYDPKPHYGTPSILGQSGVPFWISPGTGNWNTLFPRLDGAILNVVTLTKEGLQAGADGMLLTDWNDHGGYTQPGPGYYLYAYAAATGWCGEDPGASYIDHHADRILKLPGYSDIIHTLAEIYRLPPIWSKNRCQCVMALFDEPIFGNAVRGPLPPKELTAYDLTLPLGVEPVMERHSQHPLRPYFQITPAVCNTISQLAETAQKAAKALPDGTIKKQLLYITEAFLLMTDKLALSREIIACVEGGHGDKSNLLDMEDHLRILIGRLCRLQLSFTENWYAVANTSEIELTWTYFAHIISRMDYLRDWLSLQREHLSSGIAIDSAFHTYKTAGYGTLPTY